MFYIPVSLVVPGSQIPFAAKGNSDKASLDIIGEVRRPIARPQADGTTKPDVNPDGKEAKGLVVGNIRDTVKLSLDASQQVQRKNIQYSTGFSLAPGKYHMKFVVRENQSGNMGSFETDIVVPDFKKTPLKLSSVVLASQRTPDNEKNSKNPLIRDGVQWVPNVTHVFRQDQHLYFLYEVYDPSKQKGAAEPAASPGLGRREGGPVHVLTSIEFLSNGTKVYETPLVSANVINEPDRDAVGFQFDVPLTGLKPGTYVCQVNVIDDAGGSFSFPRTALRITAPVAAAPVTPATPVAAGPAQ